MNLRTLTALSFGMLSSAAFAYDNGSELHFVLAGGLTFGGDTIMTTEYTNGDSYDVKGGNLLQAGAGALWQSANAPLALQATVNYHFDRSTASNGDSRFERVPFELLAFYTGMPNWRFGGGLRYVSNPHANTHIDGGDSIDIKFKNTLGGLVEVGYRIGRAGWINGRVGFENYELKSFERNGFQYSVSNAAKIDGSYGGVNFVFAF